LPTAAGEVAWGVELTVDGAERGFRGWDPLL